MRDINELREAVKSAVDAEKEDLIEIGRHIWRTPEPGYREVRTSKYLVEKLKGLGLQVKENLAMTGFRADIDTGRPGPTLAIMGELDSLIIPNHPDADKATGAVHACGHNASATSIIGTAIGLLKSGVLKDMSGKVALIATPAEEGIELEYRLGLIREGKIGSIAGKPQLIREGVFDDVDLAYMTHLTSGNFGFNDHNGSIQKIVTFKGRSCHAASPQNGVNAQNAVCLAQNAIAFMREKYSNSDKIRIHGIISYCGNSSNVIPDEARMEYMLRAPSIPELVELGKRFDNAVTHASLAAECTCTIDTISGYMPLFDNLKMGQVLKETVEDLKPGAPFNNNNAFLSSCTDMGDVASIVPGVHGYCPGYSGTSHGCTMQISDEYSSYVTMSTLNAEMCLNLLYGDAAPAKEIAAERQGLLSIPEYIKLIDQLNGSVTTEYKG